ncbi:GGDEF domain-containing protein [Actinacidiphila bryophytorum]|uniref:Diguanylate cyclase (GGDEF) domain-containing protein n=1 Tax=Actinacidiphila bryophytorum TaxID=1436133 RepID=A0A9W4E0G9_9ACTN|nr:sensor domain-containing diguanylate cyclase [Actinacidiphila bryophytorum]MBM9436415.1 sensor domain-containing diguanylate cyclase [Actinacidiphila bryophytorum]MBN6546350.1 sensor domain-containing diguanylate cyclase [Actinacidiphila bryophytorum]CAG7601834.1 Diguanylate cyclase (GGDEF) domain-containing protein [Actinacidiphila bryophytorum]
MVDGTADLRLRAVVELAQALATAQTPQDAARAGARRARVAMGGSFAAVSAWERETGRLRVLVNDGDLAPGEEPEPADESYSVHDFPEIAEFLHGSWARGGEPHAWVETSEGTGASPGGSSWGRAAALRRRGRGSCVVAPLVLHGRAWGEVYVARGHGEPPFARPDADFATVLAAVIASGIAQTERLAEVQRLAFTDPLTGLGNRRAVDQRLDEALERHRADGTAVSLMVCDLNGLKRVNDRLGHEVGDRLLERFGSLLSLCGAMLPGSLAARLGGDEFCIVAVGSPADEVVRAAGELCLRAAKLDVGEGVACGVASTADPIGPVRSARRLFRLADAAQYRAKALRSTRPIVAGREGPEDPVVHLADSPPPAAPAERRRLRGYVPPS